LPNTFWGAAVHHPGMGRRVPLPPMYGAKRTNAKAPAWANARLLDQGRPGSQFDCASAAAMAHASTGNAHPGSPCSPLWAL